MFFIDFLGRKDILVMPKQEVERKKRVVLRRENFFSLFVKVEYENGV